MEMMKVQDIGSEEEEEEDIMLPGFRFHPTDEELVGFYLKRKVENKPITIELIKHVDIYKYDPWDLPKVEVSSNGGEGEGEREWYFFCIRGRKYRNSVRPNRVTGSGFWKATGIDKPIFSNSNQDDDHCIIGLKKSLVYYRGIAGKGTKTDWMMHEFRLPLNHSSHHHHHHHHHHHLLPYTTATQEYAEVWTLCRIFKRIPSYRKYTPNPKNNNVNPAALPLKNPNDHSTSKSSTTTFWDSDQNPNPNPNFTAHGSLSVDNPESFCFWNGVNGGSGNHVLGNGSWDELRRVVRFAADPYSQVYGSCI